MKSTNIQNQMFYKAFLTTVITEFTQISALLVDSLITTRCLGADDVAAVGLASPFFFLVGVIACCFSIGLEIRCSYEISQGNLDRVNQLFNESVKAGCWISLVVVAILLFAVPELTVAFGARGNAAGLQEPCAGYLYGLLVELLPYVLLSMITSIVSLTPGGNTVIIASAVVGGVSDIILDLVAVHFQAGTLGIGLATSISVIFSLVVAYCQSRKRSQILRLKKVPLIPGDLKEIIRIGLPKAVHGLANMITPIALNALVLAIGGTNAMAVMSCKSSLSDFLEIPAAGISGAVMLLAGIAFGEKNILDMSTILHTAHRYIFLISVGGMALIMVGSGPVAAFYFASEPDIVPLMRFMIRCLGISLPFQYLIFTRISYLETVGHLRSAHGMEILSNLLAPIALAFLFGEGLGVEGIFVAYPVSKALVCLVMFLAAGIREGHLPLKLRDYLRLNADFDISPGDYISYEIHTLEECVLASEQLMLFFKGHGLSPAEAQHASLAVEELTTNSIQHGYRKKHQPAHIDFRVAFSGDHLIIRIRDNSYGFDITEFKGQTDLLDAEENLGIRMIFASAEDIRYYRIWDTNTVILQYE